MAQSGEGTTEGRKEIFIQKPVPKSYANVSGDLRLEISVNSKRRQGQEVDAVLFDSSKVESPFLDARIIERRKDKEKKRAAASS